jgi:hypothetical protein
VPITLKLKRPNFTHWSAFFLSLCGKFGLRPHVDGTTAACPDDPAWVADNSCIHNWLLNSITDDVLGVALKPD